MDLVAYIRIVRRRWPVVVGIVALALAAAAGSWVVAAREDSQFRATHTLRSGETTNLHQAAALARTGVVPERVAETIGGSPAALSSQVITEIRTDVNFLEVTAVGVDPARTELVADTFAEELIVHLDEEAAQQRASELDRLEDEAIELREELDQLEFASATEDDPAEVTQLESRIELRQSRLSEIDARVEALRDLEGRGESLRSVTTAEAVPISGRALERVFDPTRDLASPDELSASPQLGLLARLGLGAVLGIVGGIVGAVLVDRVDPRLRTKEDVETVFGWPVVAEIPPLKRVHRREHRIMAHDAPRSRAAEAYRVLRSALLFASGTPLSSSDAVSPNGDRPAPADPAPGETDETDEEPAPAHDGRVVLVTSPSPSEGKTTTVANLAALLGEAGRKVLVVNCDFRRPALGSYIGVEDAPARVVDTPYENVKLLAHVARDVTHHNPADLVLLQQKVVAEARRRFDWVLLDTAPVLTTNDANEILASSDTVVVVARSGRTTREAADRCAEALQRRDAKVLGVVLVGAADAPAARYYYYGDYYVEHDDPDRDTARPTRPTVRAADEPS